jgi:hypothetical protein
MVQPPSAIVLKYALQCFDLMLSLDESALA